jgi:hypothetical protein
MVIGGFIVLIGLLLVIAALRRRRTPASPTPSA